MPAPVYSVCFQRITTIVGASASYVVPAGRVAILRDIDVPSGPASTAGVVFVDEPGVLVLWAAAIGGPSQPVAWRGRQVFQAGESFRVRSTLAGQYVRLSGYLLIA